VERIVVFGNSGAGKTYLAKALNSHFGYQLVHLDALFWEPGGFNAKRPEAAVSADIALVCQTRTWIAEGVFGELARAFCNHADYLIWLDLDWETCSKSLLQRGSENSRQLDTQSSEENFKELLQWTSEYWQRESASSYRGHRNLFEQFTGQKICLASRNSANEFVASIVNGQ
jgi:adenylate kinase family enzyme